MPRYSRHNDAVRYDLRWKPFSKEDFNELCDKIANSSGYKMIVWDSFGDKFLKDTAFAKIVTKGEW